MYLSCEWRIVFLDISDLCLQLFFSNKFEDDKFVIIIILVYGRVLTILCNVSLDAVCLSCDSIVND